MGKLLSCVDCQLENDLLNSLDDIYEELTEALGVKNLRLSEDNQSRNNNITYFISVLKLLDKVRKNLDLDSLKNLELKTEKVKKDEKDELVFVLEQIRDKFSSLKETENSYYNSKFTFDMFKDGLNQAYDSFELALEKCKECETNPEGSKYCKKSNVNK